MWCDQSAYDVIKDICAYLRNKQTKEQIYFRLNGDRFEGAMGDIFHLMSEIMNFKYKPIPSIDGFYGNKVSMGTLLFNDGLVIFLIIHQN